MKGTEQFKQAIQSYLENRAQTDTLFTAKFNNEKKSIDDCVTYILNTVKKSDCNGFTDDEVFGMAVHYYDEESIDVGERISARVAINRVVELTDEEKQEARQSAIDKYQEDIYKSISKKKEKKAERQPEVEQLSMF